MKTADLYREHEVSARTFYGLTAKCGGMEDGNRRLKQLVAHLSLDKEMSRVPERTLVPNAERRAGYTVRLAAGV